MNKTLLIVFVKNIILGKVKTRLAKTIGNQTAFEVYKALVDLTEKATQTLEADKRIYFSDVVIPNKWPNDYKAVQHGQDLGERMLNAFKKGFEDGYEHIILIGSDLPDISASIIEKGFEALNHNDCVFGPAEDGGYYLIGLNKMLECVFEDKPWSQSHLLEDTVKELRSKHITYSSLKTLNDIDTLEDLMASTFYQSNLIVQEKIKQLHD